MRRRGIPQLRRNIGMVFQDHRLLTDRTVFDNVALPLIIAGTPRDEIGKRVRAALDKVGLLAKEKNSPTALSAGEQQRVGIARAIVAKPPVIIADEPTGNLDPQLSAEIMNLFAEFGAVGTTVLDRKSRSASDQAHRQARAGARSRPAARRFPAGRAMTQKPQAERNVRKPGARTRAARRARRPSRDGRAFRCARDPSRGAISISMDSSRASAVSPRGRGRRR